MAGNGPDEGQAHLSRWIVVTALFTKAEVDSSSGKFSASCLETHPTNLKLDSQKILTQMNVVVRSYPLLTERGQERQEEEESSAELSPLSTRRSKGRQEYSSLKKRRQFGCPCS